MVCVSSQQDLAHRAFELGACDFFVRPYDEPRLHSTLERLEALRAQCQVTKRLLGLRHLLDGLEEPREPTNGTAGRILRRLVIRAVRRIVVLQVEEIDWFASADNYCEVHVGGRKVLYRSALRALERQLDPTTFVRIHRSTIVNRERIAELRPSRRGDYAIVLRCGTELRLSRSYRDRPGMLLDEFS